MTPEDRFAELPDIRLHYRDWGGTGRPLVLLHGLASNARIWDLTAPLLSARFRVLALDQRGHGLSDKPDDGYDFAAVCGDLAAFVEALGLDRPAVAGHSWGAGVALQFATERADAVSALICVDGAFLEFSWFPGMTWERARQMLAPPRLAGLPLDAFLQGARSWPGLGDYWNDEVQEIVLGNFRIDEQRRIYPHLTRENHFKILESIWEQKPSEMWAELRCPALLISCEGTGSEAGREVWVQQKDKGLALAQERSPGVRVLRMPDTIHDVPLQRPRELADAVLRFLDEAD
jgi:pimeloyl-ACP methyl ester carboxylesterase